MYLDFWQSQKWGAKEEIAKETLFNLSASKYMAKVDKNDIYKLAQYVAHLRTLSLVGFAFNKKLRKPI